MKTYLNMRTYLNKSIDRPRDQILTVRTECCGLNVRFTSKLNLNIKSLFHYLFKIIFLANFNHQNTNQSKNHAIKLYLFMQLSCVVIQDNIFLPGFILNLVCLRLKFKPLNSSLRSGFKDLNFNRFKPQTN